MRIVGGDRWEQEAYRDHLERERGIVASIRKHRPYHAALGYIAPAILGAFSVFPAILAQPTAPLSLRVTGFVLAALAGVVHYSRET